MLKIKIKATIVMSFLIMFSLMIPVFVLAEPSDFTKDLDSIGKVTNFDSVNINDPVVFIADIIKLLISFIGVLFLVLIIYAGFKWMTASGNPKQVDQAQIIIKTALVGLLVVFGAYILTSALLAFITSLGLLA